jgi:hypothetical protein
MLVGFCRSAGELAIASVAALQRRVGNHKSMSCALFVLQSAMDFAILQSTVDVPAVVFAPTSALFAEPQSASLITLPSAASSIQSPRRARRKASSSTNIVKRERDAAPPSSAKRSRSERAVAPPAASTPAAASAAAAAAAPAAASSSDALLQASGEDDSEYDVPDGSKMELADATCLKIDFYNDGHVGQHWYVVTLARSGGAQQQLYLESSHLHTVRGGLRLLRDFHLDDVTGLVAIPAPLRKTTMNGWIYKQGELYKRVSEAEWDAMQAQLALSADV